MAIDPGVPVLDADELAERIQADEPVAVLFYADWCGFCRAFAPKFREGAEEMEVDAVAANISDQSDPLWKRHAIDTVPTLVAFRNGEPIARVDGRPGRGLAAGDLDRLAGEIRS